jgi:hypothetical protein
MIFIPTVLPSLTKSFLILYYFYPVPAVAGFKPSNIGSLNYFSANSATITDQKYFLNSALFLPNARDSWIQTR